MPLASLTNISRIMRKNGFHQGAALMDRWFRHPAKVAKNYAPPDTGTIKMDWVLTYLRAKNAYNELLVRRMWATDAARKELRQQMEAKGYFRQGAPKRYGPPLHDILALDKFYFNQLSVGEGKATFANRAVGNRIDGLLAALGNFSLRMVIAADIQPPARNPLTGALSHPLAVTDVGIYVRDSFDFQGDQFLGYWDDQDDTISLLIDNPLNFGIAKEIALRVNGVEPDTMVTNARMRDYRRATGLGGDFLVFSDVKWTRLRTPDIIAL